MNSKNFLSLVCHAGKCFIVCSFEFCKTIYRLRCVMCHKSPCHIKNDVPHMHRKYSVKKFSRLVSSKSVEFSPVQGKVVCTTAVAVADLCLHRRGSLKSIPQTLKTPILKFSSDNIFCICVEHYSVVNRTMIECYLSL